MVCWLFRKSFPFYCNNDYRELKASLHCGVPPDAVSSCIYSNSSDYLHMYIIYFGTIHVSNSENTFCILLFQCIIISLHYQNALCSSKYS